MNEEFLHEVWRNKLFTPIPMFTTDGKSVLIVDNGILNLNSGPDFLNARLIINDIHWVGNIEIHIKSSDWNLHQHQFDPAYNNTILHVVLDHDLDVFTQSGRKLDTMTLVDKIPATILERCQQFSSGGSKSDLICGSQFSLVDENIIALWLERQLINRLEEKSILLNEEYQRLNHNWEELTYQQLAKYFGLGVNGQPFQQLARLIPINTIHRYCTSLFETEALLFGAAGFLEGFMQDDYSKMLQQEFEFQKRKLKIVPMDALIWKSHRMRPGNFPQLRLAQFAAVMFSKKHLFQFFIHAQLNKIRKALTSCAVSPYWRSHYSLGNVSTCKAGGIGNQTTDLLIINVVIPLLFFYGRVRGDDSFIEKADKFLSMLKPERNKIIGKFSNAGFHCKNAAQTQALIFLFNHYCMKKRCMNCAVGLKLIKGEFSKQGHATNKVSV